MLPARTRKRSFGDQIRAQCERAKLTGRDRHDQPKFTQPLHILFTRRFYSLLRTSFILLDLTHSYVHTENISIASITLQQARRCFPPLAMFFRHLFLATLSLVHITEFFFAGTFFSTSGQPRADTR